MSTLYQELATLARTIPGAKAYHKDTRYPWVLTIDPDGHPKGGLQELWATEVRRNGKERQVRGIVHHTPSLGRTSGVAALLPHDGLGYVFGWADEASKPDRVAQAHQAWADLVRAWASDVGQADPVAQSLLKFLDHVGETAPPSQWTSKDLVLLQVGDILAHEAPTIVNFWTSHVEEAKSGGQQGTCLVCGNTGTLVDTMPQPVKGTLIPGGQTSGIAPISINENAYGYGLTTGLRHAPICTTCAQGIPAALNHLLSDQTRTEKSPGTATTWWVTGNNPWSPNPFLDDPTPDQIKALHEAAHRGIPAGQLEPERWNSLVLAANGPRMIVRGWMNLPLREAQQNLARWFDDTEIEPRFLDGRRYQPLSRLAMATGRHNRQENRYLFVSDKAGHHFHEANEVLRECALLGSPPPRALLVHLITRITADQYIDEPRIALLRLILRRTYQRGHLMPGLDETCTEPCYVAGRLFAIYGDIQYAAATMDGGSAPNASFTDKHLAGAITDPRTAITSGEKQAPGWLNKLRRHDRAHFFQRDLDVVIGLLQPGQSLPVRASLDDQAMFILGYHHQRAHAQRQREQAKQKRLLAEQATNDTRN